MNLAIIGSGNSSRIKAEGLNLPQQWVKINGEFLINRIIRIVRNYGVKKVFCIINSYEYELKKHLTEKDFGIPLKFIVKDTGSFLHSLFALSPFLLDEPFCLTTADSVFLEDDFSNFITYSLQQNEVDGTIAITNHTDDEKPLFVAMDEEARIFKFTNSKDGYNWAAGGIYFFQPSILNEMIDAITRNINLMQDYLKLLIKNGCILKGFSFSRIFNIESLKDKTEVEYFVNKYERTTL